MRIALHRRLFIVLVPALAAIYGACGGAPTPETETAPPAPTAPAPEPEPTPPPEEPAAAADAGAALEDAGPPSAPALPVWKDLNQAERAEFMKNHVMPKMSALLKEFDPKEFAEVKCTTCHGPGAKEGKFKMPNPKLPKINDAMMKKHPEMTEFMMKKVVPEMATLLSEQPFDPATKQGFGCMRCHTAGK
jgi:hypothetical protein